jgi:type IV secretory pathway trbF protein-like protein
MHTENSSEYKEVHRIPERVIGRDPNFRDIYHRLALSTLKTRIMAYVFAATTVISFAGMWYYMTRVHDRVIAIQIDKDSGATIGVTQLKASLNAQVPDKAMEYFLVTQVISKLRSIPFDKTDYLKSIDSTYAFMTPQSKGKFQTFIQGTNTAEVLGSSTMSITTTVKSFTKDAGSPNTYNVRWQEQTFDGETLKGTENYVASIKVTVKETNDKDYRINPFGIVITDVNISKETVSQ